MECTIGQEGYGATQLAHAKTVVWTLGQAQDVANVAQRMTKGFMVNGSYQNRIYIVNFIAERLLNLLAPTLGPDGAKTEIYGTNKHVLIPKLLKKLPKNSLPPFDGGSKDFVPVAVYG